MAINTHGGGANTNAYGLKFEQDTSLSTALINKGFYVKNNTIFKGKMIVGYSLPKYELYKHFNHLSDGKWRKYVSKQLLPDEAFYNIRENTLYIIEKKFQHDSGSVDEKLQTCDFKLEEYTKLFSPVNINVVYMYVLNDWFLQPMYDDVKEYIIRHECHYFFNEIPIDVLGL